MERVAGGSAMPRFRYRGRVRPNAVTLSLAYSPTVVRTGSNYEPDATFTLRVVESDITIEVEVAAFDTATPDQFFGLAMDLVRSAVEVASFIDGIAYTVELEAWEDDAGARQPLILADRKLGALCTAFDAEDLEAVTDLVLVDPLLARVLSDVVVVLTWGHYAPIACGRVADSLVRMLTGGRKPSHWEQMQAILNVDRCYVQLLTDHSAPPRHGDRQEVSGRVNRQLAERAWTLMNRYLAYRLGGNVPLDETDFPTLQG
jgi:hypothetical protein